MSRIDGNEFIEKLKEKVQNDYADRSRTCKKGKE